MEKDKVLALQDALGKAERLLWEEINSGGFGDDKERASAVYEAHKATGKAQKLVMEVVSQTRMPV